MACMTSVVGMWRHLEETGRAGLSPPEGIGMGLMWTNSLMGKFVPCKPQKIQAFTVPPGLAHLSIIIGNVLLIHMLVLLGLINMCFQAVINNYTSSYHALAVFDTVES